MASSLIGVSFQCATVMNSVGSAALLWSECTEGVVCSTCLCVCVSVCVCLCLQFGYLEDTQWACHCVQNYSREPR